ncbi:MAG: 2-dehydro-3-deoxygalactonokinase [Rhodospirillaceae bacterium]|nr:2-dehydro-3-deoxygalactonokinase [Rhodospirillaceae bacterium]
MSQIKAIVADWGTSNLRAFALSADGAIIDSRTAPLGLLKVKNSDFAAAFDEVFTPWRSEHPHPVLLSGMIGSKLGWMEAPYVQCPASLDALGKGLARVTERENVWIVPGVCLPADNKRHDVIRGEEVQVFGALDLSTLANATLCLPGTHSKWLRADGGEIVDFSTAMTGELFDVMCNHSILAQLMADKDGAHHPDAFNDGLKRASEAGGLLNHLFSVRAEGLFNAIAPDGLRAYLSGILIGREIIDLSETYQVGDNSVLLIGANVLSQRYAEAFEHFAIPYRTIGGDEAAVRGLRLVLEHAPIDFQAF